MHLTLIQIYIKITQLQSTKVFIPQGELEGTIEKTDTGLTYASFKGIPYAAPPVGDLRFKVCSFSRS
jgi:carboxylesterase type B